MNQIELAIGETWHKDYLTQKSVTAIVQGARRWLFYHGAKDDIHGGWIPTLKGGPRSNTVTVEWRHAMCRILTWKSVSQ